MYAQTAARILKGSTGNVYGMVRTTKHDSHAYRLVKNYAIELLTNISKENGKIEVGFQEVLWDSPKTAWLIGW